MKKLMFLICIMLFSSLAVASPVGDVEYGYSAIDITSADGLIGNISSVVNVGKASDTIIYTLNTDNSMTIGQPRTGALQTGIGLIQDRLVSLHRTDRALPLEVGWRSSNIDI